MDTIHEEDWSDMQQMFPYTRYSGKFFRKEKGRNKYGKLLQKIIFKIRLCANLTGIRSIRITDPLPP